MATILKNGAVFLHIPKTGGTWVDAVLSRLNLTKKQIGPKHIHIEHLWSKYSINRRDTTIFTFVRDPLDWYESWFRYNKYNKDTTTYGSYVKERWHPNRVINGCVVESFNQTVRNIYDIRPGYVTEMFGWYTDPNLVDFVGTTGNLRSDLITILHKMGLSFDERVVMSTEPKRVSNGPDVIWDVGLRQKIFRSEYTSYLRYGIETPSDLSIN